MITRIPANWRSQLADEIQQPYFHDLQEFLKTERAKGCVCPPTEQVFTALELTPFERVKVVILGQDPYHGEGQSHGLAFSVPPGVALPPSLHNIFKELSDDLGIARPTTGSLIPWAKQGVLLFNAVLTVRANEPLSHRGRGWEEFTDAVLRKLAARPGPIVFVLWGGPAQKKRGLFGAQHHVLESAHPSPLSARRGFFGSRPFSRINRILTEAGETAIDWRLD